MTRSDKVLIIVIIVVSLIGIAAANLLPVFNQHPSYAVIRVKGEVIQKIGLTVQGGSQTIELEGPLGVSLIEVDGDKVRMVSSPCPDKLCVKQGWVQQPGKAVVCVPNQISVAVEGDDGVDAIIK